MSKARILLILGTWVAILPFLGFPSFWKNILFTATGLVLIYFSYFLHRSTKATKNSKKHFDNFVENNNFEDNTSDDKHKETTEENVNTQNIV